MTMENNEHKSINKQIYNPRELEFPFDSAWELKNVNKGFKGITHLSNPVLAAYSQEKEIHPAFDFNEFSIGVENMCNEIKKLSMGVDPTNHDEIIKKLLEKIIKVDFNELTGIPDNLKKKHYLVCCIEKILSHAKANNWGICKNHDFIYLYNGAYWKLIDREVLKTFLGEAAEKMGIDKYDARHYLFREQLYKQFLAIANLPKPDQPHELVYINLINGTFEISPERQQLRPPQRQDFLTYQLPFEYDNKADAQIFMKYLDRVLPDKAMQDILSEYMGYVFIKPTTLKLEKTLLLYGPGANGKSVFFDIINALLGPENISSYSLQSLTNEAGYFRAMLGNKRVNYASEINGNLETSIFKQLVSGEPVEARLPYGEPFILTDYAKLIFNCNELPKDVEQTNAYFRRFLILPFNVVIPEIEQDKQLAQKIIKSELPGVFNWVLAGLNRLLINKNFTECEAVKLQLEEYKKNSDSVKMFLDDENYSKSVEGWTPFKDIYLQYRTYCYESGYKICAKRTVSERLKAMGYVFERKNFGIVVCAEKKSIL